MRAAESRAYKDIPRCQGCRDVQISDGRGEIRLNELRARSPQNPRSGLSSVGGHMTASRGLFKAQAGIAAAYDE